MCACGYMKFIICSNISLYYLRSYDNFLSKILRKCFKKFVKSQNVSNNNNKTPQLYLSPVDGEEIRGVGNE